jgi:hypothetical protein
LFSSHSNSVSVRGYAIDINKDGKASRENDFYQTAFVYCDVLKHKKQCSFR